MASQNIQADDEEQTQEEELQQNQPSLRPSNNEYDSETGQGTGTAAIRTGTINRDGSTSPVSATFGTATGSLSQPLKQYTAEELDQLKEANAAGFGRRPGRIDARPRNNIYMPGTGPGTGRTAIRVGTVNRDGSTSPVSAMGSATGSLSQPLKQYTSEELDGMKEENAAGFGRRPGRIDARPRNNIYMPGTGPGTGRTAIRVGTINRDGSTSPVSGLGSATRPSSLPPPRILTPRPTPANAFAQPKPVTATPGMEGTIKTGTEPFGSNPMKGMEMPKPMVPPVIGPAVPALGPVTGGNNSMTHTVAPVPQTSSISATGAASPSSSLGMPNTGTLQANTGLPSSAGALGQGGPLKLPDSGKGDKSKVSARAKGGPVKAGKPYLVGEAGPEIIVPKESGMVVPNHAIQFLPMDERAGNAFSPAVRSDDESVRDDAAAPGLRRQISGLFMRPRAMPPEFARQQQSGGRGRFGGYASSDIAGSTSADSPPETSAGDEADDQRGDPWGSRRPQVPPAPPTAAAGRLFQKRDTPKAFFMLQRGMGAGGSSSRPSFEGDQGATAVAQLAGLAQSPRGGSSQGGSVSERLQQVAARMRAKEQRHDAPTPSAKKGAWGQAPVQTASKAPQPLASDGAESAPEQFKIHEADERAEFVLTDKKTDQPIQKDRKFGEHARSIINEELNNSPTARALLQKAYDLSGKHVVIKMKNTAGEAQPHIGLDGTITIFINPNTLRTGTLSHEIAHVIEGWKLAQGQRNRTITSGEAIDAARMDGRRELDSIAPVIHDTLLDETTGALKMARQGPRDWKENEAMRAGNIVNAEISAAKVKAQLEVIQKTDEALYKHLMNNPEEIAHMFWEEQKGKEAGIHQDNEGRPIPQGTRYGRYNYESVLKLLGNGVTREHLKKMKPSNW